MSVKHLAMCIPQSCGMINIAKVSTSVSSDAVPVASIDVDRHRIPRTSSIYRIARHRNVTQEQIPIRSAVEAAWTCSGSPFRSSSRTRCEIAVKNAMVSARVWMTPCCPRSRCASTSEVASESCTTVGSGVSTRSSRRATEFAPCIAVMGGATESSIALAQVGHTRPCSTVHVESEPPATRRKSMSSIDDQIPSSSEESSRCPRPWNHIRLSWSNEVRCSVAASLSTCRSLPMASFSISASVFGRGMSWIALTTLSHRICVHLFCGPYVSWRVEINPTVGGAAPAAARIVISGRTNKPSTTLTSYITNVSQYAG